MWYGIKFRCWCAFEDPTRWFFKILIDVDRYKARTSKNFHLLPRRKKNCACSRKKETEEKFIPWIIFMTSRISALWRDKMKEEWSRSSNCWQERKKNFKDLHHVFYFNFIPGNCTLKNIFHSLLSASMGFSCVCGYGWPCCMNLLAACCCCT